MRTMIYRNRDGSVMRNVLKLLALSLILGLARTAPGASGGAPTRAEILKGALGPMRTCFDVTSYHLDVRIDPATKSLSGSSQITFKAVDDFTKMQVDLWSNLDISKITFDDQAEAKYTREFDAVFVELPETAKEGSTHSVTVFYSGIPVVARRPPWDGGISWEHDAEGNPWVVVTCRGNRRERVVAEQGARVGPGRQRDHQHHHAARPGGRLQRAAEGADRPAGRLGAVRLVRELPDRQLLRHVQHRQICAFQR